MESRKKVALCIRVTKKNSLREMVMERMYVMPEYNRSSWKTTFRVIARIPANINS